MSDVWSIKAAEVIAKEMMKSGDPERWKGITEEQKVEFLKRNLGIIEEICPHVPKGFSAVGAAACKCAIVYGSEPVIDFLKRFKQHLFRGRNDPVYLFRTWFDTRRVSKDLELTYEITIIALIAYCENRSLVKLRVGRGERMRDIFDWTDDWRYDPNKKFRKNTEKIEEKKQIEELFAAAKSDVLIPDKESFNVREVVELSGFSVHTIQEACKSGRIKASKQLGKKGCSTGSWVVSNEDLESLIKNGLPPLVKKE